MLSLAEKYYLVVNDRFELFYRGIVKMHNPYQYYVKASCEKGYTYNRYFTYTPLVGEEGEYQLTISLYDDEGNIIESKSTILVVNKISFESNKKLNVLCIGDSLTSNGVWPYVGYERFSETFSNSLNFIGKMKKDEVGYEGYGGWQWKTFCTDYNNSVTSCVWVECKHELTEEDQHSKWMNDNREWIVETIENNRIKFKRGNNNNTCNPKLDNVFHHLEHGSHTKDIEVIKYEYSEGNPFWNKNINDIDFSYYLKENNFPTPDLVFILLSWNGQYMPYNKDFSVHSEYSQKMIRRIHNDFPNALIGLIGIQLPCCNGGITACYGASGYYHDWYGETITAFNYNEWLEKLTKNDEYKDYVFYSDLKSQFDTEYNFHTKDMPVNNRSKITERIGVNGIHPSMDGYLQMGDVFYRFLVEMIKNKQEGMKK